MRRLRSLGRTLRLDGDTPGREAGLRDRESRQRVRLDFAPTRLARSLGEGRHDRKVIMVNDPKRLPFGECQMFRRDPFLFP